MRFRSVLPVSVERAGLVSAGKCPSGYDNLDLQFGSVDPCTEASMQRDGVDLVMNDLQTSIYVASTDALACCRSCTANANCKAWTYGSDVKRCWLKRAAVAVQRANRKSGVMPSIAFTTTTATPTRGLITRGPTRALTPDQGPGSVTTAAATGAPTQGPTPGPTPTQGPTAAHTQGVTSAATAAAVVPGSGDALAGGSTTNVSTIDGCKALCDENGSCLSFEYSENQSVCSRNSIRKPKYIAGDYRSYTFCSKSAGKSSNALAF